MAVKKCTKCGEEKPVAEFYAFKLGRLGRQAECKICSNQRRIAWEKANPEKHRASKRLIEKRNSKARWQRRKINPNHIAYMKRYEKEWREKNKEKRSEQNKKWHNENKVRRNAAALSSYYENRVEWWKRNKEWVAANRDKMRSYTLKSQHKRRAAQLNSPGSFTADDVKQLYKLQQGRCAICRIDLGENFHRDHIVALSRGGSNDKYNLQLLCRKCNNTKHAKDPIEFMQSKGYLL